MLKKLVLVILSLLVVANANEKEELASHFNSKIEGVIEIVNDTSLSKDERNSRIIDSITPMVDFELMAKLSLGKAYSTLSSEDATKFIDLYVKRMKSSYSSKIDAYENEKVEIKEILQEKPTRITLKTDLVGKGSTLEVNYKYYKPTSSLPNKDAWLIYDVEISGVSILKADVAQFREFLSTKSVQDLITYLDQN
ncbi:MAG: ABC transporter substrate-binding protein [Sulfuricurvum sp.]